MNHSSFFENVTNSAASDILQCLLILSTTEMHGLTHFIAEHLPYIGSIGFLPLKNISVDKKGNCVQLILLFNCSY